jgi:hypothetical protein
MTVSIKESLDEIIVSKLKQTSATAAQTMALKYLLDEGSNLEVNEGRTDNTSEKSGYEEATRIDLGVRELTGVLSQAKARPDFLAWLVAHFCNHHTEAAAGSTGFLHTSKIDPTAETGSYQTTPAYFTAAQKRGSIADFRRFTGNMINSLKLPFKMGSPLSVSADVLGIGDVDDQTYQEIVVGTKESTTLTLSKAVYGESINYIQVMADVDDDGDYEHLVTCVGIVNSTKVLTITAPSTGSTAINYMVTYRVINTETGYEWADTATGITSTTEFSIQTRNIKLVLFGKPAAASFSLGQTAGVELESLEYSGSWNARVLKSWRQGSTVVNEATGVQNGPLRQTIKLSRQMKDLLLTKFWKRGDDEGAQFSLYIECLGPEYESGQNYAFNVIVPRVGLMNRTMKVSNGLWVEEGDLLIMKDTKVGNLPSVTFQTRNQVSGYLVAP